MKSTPSHPNRKQNVRHDHPGKQSGAGLCASGKWLNSKRHTLHCFSLCVMALAFSLHPTRAGDLFWQIRVGHDILLTGQPPHFDTYSWTRQGQPWVVNEWLSFVILFELFHWTQGFAGPFLFQEAMIIGIGISLYFFLCRSTRSFAAAYILSCLSIIACTVYWQPRPYLFTYLFLIFSVGVCTQVRQNMFPAWTLWLLIPLFLLWANLHQGVTVGVGFVVTLAVAGIAEYAWFTLKSASHSALERKTNAIRFSLLSLACVSVSVLTPYGLGLYKMILVTITDHKAMSVVMEWKPLKLTLSVYDLCLLILAILVIVGAAKDWKKIHLAETIFLVLITYEAVEHRRNVPLAVLAGAVLAAPLIAPVLHEITKKLVGLFSKSIRAKMTGPRLSFVTPASVCILLFSFAFILTTISSQKTDTSNSIESLAQTCFKVDRFPDEACSFIEYEHFPTNLRLYNDFNIGGFLILHCPEYRVFTDGRIDVYAGSLLDGVLSIDDPQPNQVNLTESDKKFLTAYHFNCAVTANPLTAKYFAQQPDWSLVYVHHRAPILDRTHLNAWIFVRHQPDLEELITRGRNDWAAHNHGIMPDPDL